MTENKIAIDTLEAMKKQFLPPTRDILDMAIQALVDIQQYRAIGTVEECQQRKEYFDIVNEVLKNYSDIGTIEECRTAVERMKPKKVAYQGEHKKCPTCGSFYVFGRHCTECGQAVDYD